MTGKQKGEIYIMIPGLGHSKKKAEEEKQSQIPSPLSQGEEKSTDYFSNNPRIMRYTGLFVTSPPEHPGKNPGSRLQLFQLQLTMGNLRPGHWPLILVYMLLLQIQPIKLQGVDSLSQKLRRLNEQFQQFKTLTKARLDMLSLNQNRNSSEQLGNRVQSLTDQWQHMSQDLEHLKQSTTQELEGLREWSRKLEKKSKRMEGRLALMERNMRENRRQAQKQKPDPDQDFFNLTQELQSQEERLAALQAQRDELLVGLKGLQESLKNQALRVTRLEGRLDEFLLFNEGGKTRGLWRAGEPLSSNITPQEYYEPRRRSQTHRGGKPGRVLDGHAQPRPQGISYSQTDHSQATAQSRNPQQPQQHQATPNQPKPSKAHKQISTDYLPQLDPYQPQSQIQVGTQTRPYPLQQEQVQSRQTVPYSHASTHNQRLYHQRGHQMQNISFPSWPQPLSHPEHAKDRQSRTRLQAPQPHSADVLPLLQSESYQPRVSGRDGGQEEKSDTKVIHNLLQLPVRQKIPTRPIPKKEATICNVDSVLFFPSASAENYVTFSLSLPDLPELSVCLWLRVEASHVGTLLSYATEDNDNQLVLYGRNSSASSSSLLASSSSFHHWYSSSSSLSSSSPSLDFVIGDPVYRRLPVSSLLDTRWHHLCIVWSSIQGRFWHYSDRRLTSSGSNFRKGWEIPGGGSVVLGQEQDDVGGVFDPAEGFAGQLAGFRVWNRVLSPSEVEGLAEGRGVPRGVVLGMEDIKEVHGEVQQVACECLEHCV